MVVSREFEQKTQGYFMHLERKLRTVDPGIEFHLEKQRAMIGRVTHPLLEARLPGLVYRELAHYTIWQSPAGFGLKERFDIGSLHSDEHYAKLRRLPPPRWNTGDAIKLARFVGPRLACEQMDEHVGSPPHEPVLGTVHRFYDWGPSLQIYAGSAMYLRNGEYETLEESPLEQRLRQYLDFLHTLRQENEPRRAR
jgi:hypothetical protein